MKITSMNPLIVTRDSEKALELFKEMGFNLVHEIDHAADTNISNFSLKDASGNKIDISQAGVERDLTLIRINVDNFDEAVELLKSKGFTLPQKTGGGVLETETNKSALVVSPTVYAFDLCMHKK